MKQNDEFEFELNKSEGSWSVTGYNGKSEEVIFPASYKGMPVKTIGDMIFYQDKRIKHVIIPEGFTSIEETAFSGCRRLTEIKLPESLTSIGRSAFEGCTGLMDIKLPESLTSIGEQAFRDCAGLTDIKLPESLASIGESAFRDCTGLTNIEFPKSLTSIGESAFHGCTGLTDIKLPEGLTLIERWTFDGCTGLTNVKFPKSLASFDDSSAFEDCTELTEITVDEDHPVFCSLDGVLFDKDMVTLIYFPVGKKGKYFVPDGVIGIKSGAFNDCEGITAIYFPQSVLSIKDYRFNNEQLTDITVNESNPMFCSIDGVLFNKEKTCLIEYPKNKDKTDYTVPDGIIYIDHAAFARCKRLVSITLPERLELIDTYAFAECQGLKDISLPANLRYIGERAFKDCPNLETVTLSRKTKIGYKAFEEFTGKLVYRD